MEHSMIPASRPWSDGGGPSYENEYSELAAAIVSQAVKDYMSILHRLWMKGQPLKNKKKLLLEKAELENFFYSDWCSFLSDIDPGRLIEACQRKALELEKEAIQRQNRKRFKDLQKAEEGVSKQ